MIQAKIIEMTEGDYHGLEGHLSNSTLTHFLKSPAHYQAHLRSERIDTPSMILGRAIHQAILEPKRIESLAILPEIDRRTKEGKAIYQDFLDRNPGKTIIKKEEFDIVKGCVDSVYSHGLASDFLSGAKVEQSILFEIDGVKCKSRIDAYNNGVLIDVKSTADDSRPGVFSRTMNTYGYHRQMAFYTMACKAVGLPVEKRIIIAVEKDDPFAVSVLEIDPNAYWKGEQEVLEGVAYFKKCLESDKWPSYEEVVHLVGLPAYAY